MHESLWIISSYRLTNQMYKRIEDLQFYVLFSSISVTSGHWADDNERLCAMEPCLWLRRFWLECSSNSGQLNK